MSYNSLFVNSASDKVGYFGTQGLGFNRDGFSGNGDGGFYQMNAQFNQDIILVNQITGSHRFEDGKFVITWGSGYNKYLLMNQTGSVYHLKITNLHWIMTQTPIQFSTIISHLTTSDSSKALMTMNSTLTSTLKKIFQKTSKSTLDTTEEQKNATLSIIDTDMIFLTNYQIL